MDETQHFCLRWNNYQSSITSAFENLRDDEDFVDVTLACEGRSIKAHRVVLSACSPYFRDLLKSTPCKHPVILLQDVNFHDLHSLVEFIYHGEVNVHQKSLQSFLKTAEVLRVSGLTQQQAEETNSQLLQIQNLANSGVRTPLNSHHSSMQDDSPLYPRSGSPPPPPFPPTQLPLYKRSIAMIRREQHNNSTSSAEDPNNVLKRMRSSDNGLPPSNTNSPDIVHTRSTSPQLTPTDFSTMKHNNNNSPPPKDEKRNGSSLNVSGNGNGSNTNTNGNGISSSEKLGSLTPSPLTRSAEDVKSEPMELVCPNNNDNEHSNDSTGENEVHRANSADCGKGSLSSGNDEEIENTMPPHPASAPFPFSPGEKLFPSAPFPPFSMSNIDAAAFANLNPQLQTAAELAASPQGGSTNLLGGVIVPGVNPNTSSNHHHHHHHSTHALHQHEHHMHSHHQQQQQQQQQQHQQHQQGKDRNSEQRDNDLDNERDRERHGQRETPDLKSHHQQQQQQHGSFPNTPSPHHHPSAQSQQSQTPPPHLSHAHSQFALQQHQLSLMPSHHLHSHHDLSPSSHHHHHHLTRAPSPYDHHHLLQHRRSSLSPSPTGRSSNTSSAAGILASSRASELGGGNRLLLPLPLNACHRCDVCGKLLSTKLTLKRHKEQQHLQPLNNAVCNLCHKVFRTLNSLNNHKSIYHRRQKHHSYFHHGSVGSGVGSSGGPGSRLHQSLSSLQAAAAANNSVANRNNDNAVAAAAAAAAAAAELLLSPIVGAGAGSAGPTMQMSSHPQQSSPNIVKPCMDYL